MFGKGFLKRVGRAMGHGAKAVYETGKNIGSKILASPYAMPLAVAGLTASGYGATAIPAFLAASATARQIQDSVGGLHPIMEQQHEMPIRQRPIRQRPIQAQGTRTTQGAMRNWGDQYGGGNRQLGRGNFRSRIPQMRPDGMN